MTYDEQVDRFDDEDVKDRAARDAVQNQEYEERRKGFKGVYRDMDCTSWVGGACNGHNIVGLSYGGGAEAKMKEFFESQIQRGDNVHGFAKAAQVKNYRTPAAHYVFTGGGATGYAQNFAKYIEDHGLGDLATLGPRENKLYHAGRKCQIWIWAPDVLALVKWYEKLMTPKPKIDPVIVKAHVKPIPFVMNPQGQVVGRPKPKPRRLVRKGV